MGPIITDPIAPGVILRTPITFLGTAQGRQDFALEEFINDAQVITAVQSIRTAATDAERVVAVNQLMENLE